jgi:sulfotransferase
LQRRVKILVTVRDVRAIVASFEKLYRRRSIDYRDPTGEGFYQGQNVEGRVRMLLGPKSVVGLTIARLRDALARGMADRLLIVPYRALTTCPGETMSLLHGMLGLDPFIYDPTHVEQITHEDDHYHGMNLHKIRTRVEPPAETPWKGLLPEETCRWIEEEYADINRFAQWHQAKQTPKPMPGNGLKA